MLIYQWSKYVIPFAFAGLGLIACNMMMDDFVFVQIVLWFGVYLFAKEYRFFEEAVKKTVTVANQENLAYVAKPIEGHSIPQDLEENKQHRARSFVHLNPVVSYPQKKLVFYRCQLHKKIKDNATGSDIADFFEKLQFITTNIKKYRDVRFIVDLPFGLLKDETYRDIFITHVRNGDYVNEALLFDISHEVLISFDVTLSQLGEMGLRYSLEYIESETLQDPLGTKSYPFIYCYQIKQNALLALIKDTFLNEKIHEISDSNIRIMVTDLDDETQIEDLPTIVDYAAGRALGAGITVPFV